VVPAKRKIVSQKLRFVRAMSLQSFSRKKCKIFLEIENDKISRKNAKIFQIMRKFLEKTMRKIREKNGNYAKKKTRKFREKYRIFKNKCKI